MVRRPVDLSVVCSAGSSTNRRICLRCKARRTRTRGMTNRWRWCCATRPLPAQEVSVTRSTRGVGLVELGDEESVTEIQLLLIEKISVLAVPFAAREVSAQS